MPPFFVGFWVENGTKTPLGIGLGIVLGIGFNKKKGVSLWGFDIGFVSS